MAYAPGAIEAMTIIAFALHLDPVFVGVHHLARFTFMSMVLPAAVGLIRAYEARARRAIALTRAGSPRRNLDSRFAGMAEAVLLRRHRAVAERQFEPLPHVDQRLGERDRSARPRDRARA